MASLSSKASCWSITINNPTPDDYTIINGLTTLKWVKEWKGQIEQGEEGTTHIQGMLRTEHVRFSQVKKALPRAHIEQAKNPMALSNYVEKDETRIGTLPTYEAAQPTDVYNQVTLMYPSYDHLMAKYMEYKMDRLQRELPDNFALNILDDAVDALIKQGKIAEFMCSNPAFRTAFKTYFSSIMLRTYSLKTYSDIDIEE
nr:MAG: replication associated protein [Cressdnaviricota sp.]